MEYVIVHHDDVYESDSKKLTTTSFSTLKQCAFKWFSLDCTEKVIAAKNLQLWDMNSLTDLSPSGKIINGLMFCWRFIHTYSRVS